jgi:hypothetical protein
VEGKVEESELHNKKSEEGRKETGRYKSGRAKDGYQSRSANKEQGESVKS